MKKIISLFVRNHATGELTREVTPGAEWVQNAPIGDVPLTLEAVKAFAEKCLKAEPPQVIIPYFAKRSK